MNKYTEKELFAYMDSGRSVKVTCDNGRIFTGRCWAYTSGANLEEFGVDEPSIEVQDTVLYLSDIQTIEYSD